MYHLLDDPLFRWEGPAGTQSGSLPDALAALADGRVTAWPACADHHRQHLHAFCCQVAALALEADGVDQWDDTLLDSGHWRRRLRLLTPNHPDDEPWHLVIDDLNKPAFLQPAQPGGWKSLPNLVETADQLDLLTTSKNFDVKAARSPHQDPERWIHHLITYQAASSFGGRGTYGSVRMNGGYSARPAIALAWGTDPAQRFQRDLRVLMAAREDAIRTHQFRCRYRLLWLEPWTGSAAESIVLTDCHPWFLEVCRRVRLISNGNRLSARTGTSDAARIDGKEAKGVTGDIWTPIAADGSKSLTVKDTGWGYDLIAQLLCRRDTWGTTAALRYDPVIDGSHQQFCLIAQVLSGDMGGTNGWHERILHAVPARIARQFNDPETSAQIWHEAETRIDIAHEIQNRALKPALAALQQRGHDKLELQKDWARNQIALWASAFDRAIDQAFFPQLWDDLSHPGKEASAVHRQWALTCLRAAEQVLQQAIPATPIPVAQRYRIITAATGRFWGAIRSSTNASIATHALPASLPEEMTA